MKEIHDKVYLANLYSAKAKKKKNKRIKELKNMRNAFLYKCKCISLLTIIVSIFIISSKIYDSISIDKEIKDNYACMYISVTVKDGQTLSEICEDIINKCPTDLYTVKELTYETARQNDLLNIDHIEDGQTLYVPYYTENGIGNMLIDENEL